MVIHRNKYDDAVRSLMERLVLKVSGTDINGNVHAGPPRIDDPCVHFDKATDEDRFVESNSTNVDRHAIVAAPTYRTGIASLVDPTHDGSAMYLPSEIHVGRLREKAQMH